MLDAVKEREGWSRVRTVVMAGLGGVGCGGVEVVGVRGERSGVSVNKCIEGVAVSCGPTGMT